MLYKFLSIFLSVVCSTDPTYAKDVTHLYETDSARFKKSIIQQVKESLCKEEQNFLTCYQLSEKQCQDDVEVLFDSCLKKHLKGIKVNIATESDQIIQEASLCLGKAYHKKNQKKFLKHKSCREIN